ncbi:hypothetical protein ACLOJK_002928 [Asimina triloba]
MSYDLQNKNIIGEDRVNIGAVNIVRVPGKVQMIQAAERFQHAYKAGNWDFISQISASPLKAVEDLLSQGVGRITDQYIVLKILKEGAGHQVGSAFVEIVFDNSDNWIPVEEVQLKVYEKSKEMHERVLEAHDKLKSLDKEFKSLTKDIHTLTKEKEAMEKRQTDAIKMHAQTELDVEDLQEKISVDFRAKDEARRQLQSLKIEIEDSRSGLTEIILTYKVQVSREEEITKKIMDSEKQLSILYQKQGQAIQFSSEGARDKWLQKEIDDLECILSSNSVQEKKLNEIQLLDEELREQDDYLEGWKADLQKQESLWKKESNLSSEIHRMKAEVVKAEKSLDHVTLGVTELDAGYEKIRELISVLDQQRNEAIARTFKGVAQHFREAFSELVRGGHGFLVMMKKKICSIVGDVDAGNDYEDEDGPQDADSEGRVENYAGIKLRFVKLSIWAMLLFLISVVGVNDSLAVASQEAKNLGSNLVKVADMTYGVTYKNAVSHVDVVSKEEALDFIKYH